MYKRVSFVRMSSINWRGKECLELREKVRLSHWIIHPSKWIVVFAYLYCTNETLIGVVVGSVFGLIDVYFFIVFVDFYSKNTSYYYMTTRKYFN